MNKWVGIWTRAPLNHRFARMLYFFLDLVFALSLPLFGRFRWFQKLDHVVFFVLFESGTSNSPSMLPWHTTGSKRLLPIQELSKIILLLAIDKWDPIVFVDQIWDQNRIKHKKLDHLAFGIVRKDQITAEIEQNQDPKKIQHSSKSVI